MFENLLWPIFRLQAIGKLCFPFGENSAKLEPMPSGRLHVAEFNTVSNPLAVSSAGFVTLAMISDDDGKYGDEMNIIVK